MKSRSILISVVVAFATATSFAFAHPADDDDDDWGGAVLAAQHQMAQQARLTASVADANKQLLYLSDGSVLTLYSSNMECRKTVMSSPYQQTAWQPC